MVFGLAKKRLAELKHRMGNETVCVTPNETFVDKVELSRETLIETTDKNTCDLATLQRFEVSYRYVTAKEEVSPAIAELLQVKTIIGLDIETYGLSDFSGDKMAGLDPRKSGIRTIQLYDGDKCVYIFDVMQLGDISLLGNDIWEKPMIAHNAVFELKHLVHNGVTPKKLGCTLLADRILNGQRRDLKPELGLSKTASLKDLSKELLKVEVAKELQVSEWNAETLTPEQLEYAALDALLVTKIFPIQVEEIKKQKLARAYQLIRDAQIAIVQMELCGIGFDVAKHQALIEEWKKDSDTLHDTIIDTLGKELNLNSTKQLGEWLNEALKQEDLEEWAKTPKGQLSTSTHTFKLNEHMHDTFPKLVQYRHLAKRISSFGKSLYKFIDIEERRLYGSFSLGTTTTGRMASSKPNMQNMPRTGFRDLFCAQEGYKLVSLDYSQQELRVVAIIAQDEKLLGIYKDGGDVHTITASSILKIPIDQVTKEQRQLAKAVIFGLLYGQGAKGLAKYAKQNYGVDMTEQEADKHKRNLFKTYPGLKDWQRQIGDTTRFLQVIRTQCGRIRDFSKEVNGYRYTAALNLPIQGAAAEITLSALVRITPFICDECRLVNVVHDEILLEVKQEKAREFADKVQIEMEQAFLDVFPKSEPYLKNLVEAKIGDNWAQAK